MYQSSIGEIYVVAENDYIVALHIGNEDFLESEKVEIQKNSKHPLLMQAVQQLDEYFSGQRKDFDLPLQEQGTVFQTNVWNELKKIPYGKTVSYQDVATAIGNTKAVRAIGQANKANKLPIIVPCHRVIGKDQSLTGYAGTQVHLKEQLLEIEGALFKK
ncbi:methylated-DNA--[protein]-cysteine S-methyltransferase [Robertmurraya yapensis]|uniref:Methylated-DNA--protein-cysteine methyltransferase n=2 Tax=Bacillaceae TaxID=186817 RepID=A0A431WAE8_9BACI|nr:methylated-DNA--[protein]-cysteine S-methyltransferase [Bacillus yapensis]RTR32466.1 methylated-DNA--[protein]-cysteine S-methyltransferase [Bacillus yapensis]TKS96660.1 methylated-DNA--[protein]-cysteine S-methyltransferase [Bacillus yapensis]